MIDVRLPFPVSSNAVWTRTKHGIRKTDKYDAWLKEVGWTLKEQKAGKVPGKYKLFIQAVPPDKRKRDLDNIIGSISDALQAFGVVENDSLCVYVSAQWITQGKGARVVVVPATVPANQPSEAA